MDRTASLDLVNDLFDRLDMEQPPVSTPLGPLTGRLGLYRVSLHRGPARDLVMLTIALPSEGLRLDRRGPFGSGIAALGQITLIVDGALQLVESDPVLVRAGSRDRDGWGRPLDADLAGQVVSDVATALEPWLRRAWTEIQRLSGKLWEAAERDAARRIALLDQAAEDLGNRFRAEAARLRRVVGQEGNDVMPLGSSTPAAASAGVGAAIANAP